GRLQEEALALGRRAPLGQHRRPRPGDLRPREARSEERVRALLRLERRLGPRAGGRAHRLLRGERRALPRVHPERSERADDGLRTEVPLALSGVVGNSPYTARPERSRVAEGDAAESKGGLRGASFDSESRPSGATP